MSGRGRGGGRGRGTPRGILMEQVGAQKKEPVVIQDTPPETYPPLQFHPLPLPKEKEKSAAYMLVVKKAFREYLQNSEYYIQLDAEKADIERYSDRFNILTNKKNNLSLCWSRFPSELQPQKKGKRKFAPTIPKSLKKAKEINEKLDELEKKESNATEGENDDDDEDETEVAEDAEEDNDEMDEGTDYINSYFDNGEDYVVDDDDALDECVM